jgi:hypothetical protein
MGTSSDIAVIIPFRDRGSDPLRAANLKRVMQHWGGDAIIVGDGYRGQEQFNRSAAYNRGAELTDAEVIVYAESDMLIPHSQIQEAAELAASAPGLVVPFTEYHYLTPQDSQDVRDGLLDPVDCVAEFVKDGRSCTGAINVLSRETLDAVGGWDETFQGNWYDDTAMHIAFEITAGPTRWVNGPAYHVYHLPGWMGDHLTDEDKAATEANKTRLRLYEQAETAGRIRELTSGRVHA